MMEGPRQQVFRASSGGVSVRLRINVADVSWLTIKAPGKETCYRELKDDECGAVLTAFSEIGDSPERFTSFVNNYSTQ
jgi:hypothetical protein